MAPQRARLTSRTWRRCRPPHRPCGSRCRCCRRTRPLRPGRPRSSRSPGVRCPGRPDRRSIPRRRCRTPRRTVHRQESRRQELRRQELRRQELRCRGPRHRGWGLRARREPGCRNRRRRAQARRPAEKTWRAWTRSHASPSPMTSCHRPRRRSIPTRRHPEVRRRPSTLRLPTRRPHPRTCPTSRRTRSSDR